MSAGDAVNDLFQQYMDKLGNVNPKAVGIQLALMLGLSLGTILAFSVLRPRNKLIYAPKYKYSTEEKRPPRIDDGLFSWIGPLRTLKEPEMLAEMGLDAVVFLRFLRMCRWLFTAVSLVSCGVLIPINLIYNLKEVPAANRNFLSSLTIADVKGNSLYAHVAVSYIICFIAFWFIWVNYKRVVELKHAYFRSKEYEYSLHARSIMITGVQRQYQTDEGLQSLLTGLGIPYPVSSVHIGRKVGQLPELVEAHNDLVRELEGVLTTYTKDGKLAHKRPTMRVGGFMGMGGKTVDTIEYMTAKIKRLEDMVEQTRETISDKKSEPYGFASFQAVPYAHVVAKRLQDKKVKGCKFSLAPLPSDIIWKNLSSHHRSKAMSRGVIAIFLIALCGFYTIPLVAVSFLANLAAITQYVGFLNTWSIDSEWSFSAFVGVVPPLLSAILQLLLPIIMRKLTQKQGLLTRNQVDRTVLARYWAFLIITQLIIFSLLGVVFQLVTELVIEFGKGGGGSNTLRTILSEVNKLPSRINATYLNQSNYWLTWLPLRAWAAVFDIAQVINLVWVWARTRAFGRTPREIREWTKPPAFDYAVYIANSLLVVAVAFIYAPLAPLVPVLAAIAFFTSSLLYKYCLIYVNVTAVESGGRMWRLLVNRILICLVFQQAILVLTIGLQQGWIRSITCVPPVALVIIFKICLARTFDDKYTWYSPSDQEVANAVLHRADERKGRLFKRFGNPVLSEPLFTPMIHKQSQHLLRQIYSGRVQEDDYIEQYGDAQVKAGMPVKTTEMGGLRFKAVEESELEQSREAYLREQDAWESGSVSTAMAGSETPMLRGDAAQGFFENKKREYLANGPSRPASIAGGSLYGYDLSRVPSGPGMPAESQENLLYANNAGRGAGTMYPAGYNQAAMSSFDDVGTAHGYNNGSGFFGENQQQQAHSGYSAPQYQAPLMQYSGSNGSAGNYPPSYDNYPPLPPGAGGVRSGSTPPQQYSARYSPDMDRRGGNGGQHMPYPSNASAGSQTGYYGR